MPQPGALFDESSPAPEAREIVAGGVLGRRRSTAHRRPAVVARSGAGFGAFAAVASVTGEIVTGKRSFIARVGHEDFEPPEGHGPRA
jgi:hypothetical protein